MSRWRLRTGFSPDPDDDMVLELVFAAGCRYLVTHNVKDFQGPEQLGNAAVTPGNSSPRNGSHMTARHSLTDGSRTNSREFSYAWSSFGPSKPMSCGFILCLLMVVIAARGDIATEPWPNKVRDFATDLPSTLEQGDFQVTISEPNDPGVHRLGGSGGPLLAFTVRDEKNGWQTTFYDQSIGTGLLEPFHGYPQLEIWGRGGGGSWSRCLARFVRGGYRCVRIDEFTSFEDGAAKKAATAMHPLTGDTLYFVETRIPKESAYE